MGTSDLSPRPAPRPQKPFHLGTVWEGVAGPPNGLWSLQTSVAADAVWASRYFSVKLHSIERDLKGFPKLSRTCNTLPSNLDAHIAVI